jgi:chromosome segregation ATPase
MCACLDQRNIETKELIEEVKMERQKRRAEYAGLREEFAEHQKELAELQEELAKVRRS